MNMIVHPDGSIEFPDGIPGHLRFYAFEAATEKPNTFRPKFKPCKFRENKCGLSPCRNRAIFQWNCTKFRKLVVLSDCEGCNARTEH